MVAEFLDFNISKCWKWALAASQPHCSEVVAAEGTACEGKRQKSPNLCRTDAANGELLSFSSSGLVPARIFSTYLCTVAKILRSVDPTKSNHWLLSVSRGKKRPK